MKIAVFGSMGMLGSMVTRLFRQAGHDLLTPGMDEVDFVDGASLERFYQTHTFEGAVNCAAFTAVDECEKAEVYPLVLRLNAEAVGTLARLSRETGRWLIHISTDYVFDGTGTSPHPESDPAAPLNAYGRSKWEGEKRFNAEGTPGWIVRTSWLYGPNGKHFVATMARLLREKDHVDVVDDQVGGPTYTGSLARFLLDLAETKPARGTYHYADLGYVSWHGLTLAIRDELGLKTPVVPVTSAQFVRPAKRPANSRFDLTKAMEVARTPLRPWREALQEYLRENERA